VRRACVFPEAIDPNSTSINPPEPLTDEIVNEVRSNLLARSATAPDVLLVSPGAPEESFLLDAIAGAGNNRGYRCTNQDSSHESQPKPCGDHSLLCETAAGRERFDTIARWITEGAPDN
jgi:hypothetical protein